MSNYFRELSTYTKQCYGGYCNLCRNNNIEPVHYQKFADNFDGKTKSTFKKIHGDLL
jgi:hypothetical protein